MKTAAVETLPPPSRLMSTKAPDGAFFADFLKACENAPTPEALGVTHNHYSELRGVTDEEQAGYAAILAKAYEGNALEDPKAFLQSLDCEELELVRKNHCLANTINTQALSREGAYNLLLPDGYTVDLNRDDIEEIGAAKTIHFPPRNAPEEFKAAWFEATKDMKEMDAATHGLTIYLGMHSLPIGDGVPARTMPTEAMGSYRAVIANYLAMLKTYRSMLPAGQYERDTAFFGKLERLIEG